MLTPDSHPAVLLGLHTDPGLSLPLLLAKGMSGGFNRSLRSSPNIALSRKWWS